MEIIHGPDATLANMLLSRDATRDCTIYYHNYTMPRRRIIEDSSDEETNDSPSSIPSNDRLEKALRDTVANIFRTGKLEELTVKRVRTATETALGLEEGFFKAHEDWKTRSDQIIKDEAVRDALYTAKNSNGR